MYQTAVRYAGHRHGSGFMRASTAILKDVITRSLYLTYQYRVFNKALLWYDSPSKMQVTHPPENLNLTSYESTLV